MSESTGKPTIQALRRRQRLFEKQIQDRASEFKTFATERTCVEEELSRSREELRTLAARLQAVREEERARLAREIHDELSGSLTALKMDLSLLPDRAAKDRNLFLEKITSMSLLIDDALARVHAIVTELRPVVLDKFGLVAAIEWQAGEFQERSGIACETYLPAEEILLDSDRSTAVFRILQEALTNVMRHANATKVVVDLRSEAETLILSVRDNGIGIDPKVIYAPNSTGLLGMRERALSLGGVIGITTLPEGGYITATDIEDRKQAEERVQRENIALREEVDKASMFEEIVGSSNALRKVLLQIAKVAPTDSTVLITGETGTGKELIARAIHKRSRRSSRPFVSVDCSAIPQPLIASELFGHEKGAYTGALQRRLGRFELAEGGTIFLDEVGDLPSETQNTLLRVLQEHEFERVGGTQTIRADVRVIAATNCDLMSAMTAGTFRSDLFYRLNVFPIETPSLRERKEDIPMLVEYFIDRYASKAGKEIKSINKKSVELLQRYSWPGNIRELQNVIERGVIVCETETLVIDENWLPRNAVKTPPLSRPLSEELLAREKERIEAALAETRGRVSGASGAAAKLGIPPSTLDSKIRSLKINRHRFKTV